MTKIPSRRANQKEIEELLARHVERGLRLSFDEENWFMSCGPKNDSGSIRMPLRIVLKCADQVLK